MDKKKKYRVIVKPVTPRNVPQTIPAEKLIKILDEALPHLQKVIYAGWIRRNVNKKKRLQFLAATGNTSKEARENFKKSEAFGENVWLIAEK